MTEEYRAVDSDGIVIIYYAEEDLPIRSLKPDLFKPALNGEMQIIDERKKR